MKLPVHFASHTPASGEVRDVKVGDILYFLCNGRGRGGHYVVHAKVTKVNRITVEATECVRSYGPGTKWKVHQNSTSLRIVEEFAVTPDEIRIIGVTFRQVPPMSKQAVEAFRKNSPIEAAKIDAEVDKYREQFPELFKK